MGHSTRRPGGSERHLEEQAERWRRPLSRKQVGSNPVQVRPLSLPPPLAHSAAGVSYALVLVVQVHGERLAAGCPLSLRMPCGFYPSECRFESCWGRCACHQCCADATLVTTGLEVWPLGRAARRRVADPFRRVRLSQGPPLASRHLAGCHVSRPERSCRFIREGG